MKKLFLLIVTSLLFVVGVQSVGASVLPTQFEEDLVVVQDITTVNVDLDTEQEILNLKSEGTVGILESKEGVITDNLKYPTFDLDAILINNFKEHTLYSTTIKYSLTLDDDNGNLNTSIWAENQTNYNSRDRNGRLSDMSLLPVRAFNTINK